MFVDDKFNLEIFVTYLTTHYLTCLFRKHLVSFFFKFLFRDFDISKQKLILYCGNHFASNCGYAYSSLVTDMTLPISFLKHQVYVISIHRRTIEK